jgi:hypothetical protein
MAGGSIDGASPAVTALAILGAVSRFDMKELFRTLTPAQISPLDS